MSESVIFRIYSSCETRKYRNVVIISKVVIINNVIKLCLGMSALKLFCEFHYIVSIRQFLLYLLKILLSMLLYMDLFSLHSFYQTILTLLA